MADTTLGKYLAAGETSVSNLLLHHYHALGMNTAELMVYLQLKSYLDQGEVPNIKQVANHLQTDVSQVYELISSLTSHQFLVQTLGKDAAGKEQEVYDFAPLYAKLARYLDQQATVQETTSPDDASEKLFAQFENSFGRLLSTMEATQINDWLEKDHYDPGVIELALREAVLTNNLSFRYVDRVLLSWQRRNLTTVQAVEADQKRYEAKKAGPKPSGTQEQRQVKFPIFKLRDQEKG